MQNKSIKNTEDGSECKYSLRVSKVLFAKIIVAVLVFLLSLIILPYYTEGDQRFYRAVYETLPSFSLIEGYPVYSEMLSTREFGYYFLSWTTSRFINKDLFIAMANAVLAYLAMCLFLKWKSSIIIAILLVFTNYYFLVLYFAAERLKFAFIFLILSLFYLNLKQSRKFCLFAIPALVTHMSVSIVYVSVFLNSFIQKTLNLFITGKINRNALFFAPLLLIPCFVLRDHISSKFLFYSSRYEFAFSELWKMLAFLVLALWYSSSKREALMMFIPLIIAVSLVGGARLNIFGYFVFLYHGLQYKQGMNFGVLTTSMYFFYSSAMFLNRIVQYGHGF